MTGMTNEARCKAYCDEREWPCEKVTWYTRPPGGGLGRHHDFLGCIDLIICAEDAIKDGASLHCRVMLFVQTTSGSNHAARRDKVLAYGKELQPWLAAGAVFEIWSWSLRGPRRKRKHWTLRRERLEF
jgi:hypothetical protein